MRPWGGSLGKSAFHRAEERDVLHSLSTWNVSSHLIPHLLPQPFIFSIDCSAQVDVGASVPVLPAALWEKGLRS